MPKKLLFSVLALIIFFSACEIIVRVSGIKTYHKSGYFLINRDMDYPDVTLRDKKLFWRLKPNSTIASEFFDGDTIQTNSLGFRGNEISKTKTLPRIIALGNSCTFGWGVDRSNIFTSLLTEMLQDKYEVINAGVPGYTSYQGKELFQAEIESLKPDILLVLFAWNDHWPAAMGISDKEQRFPPQIILSIQNQLARLHTYRLIRKWILSATGEKNQNSSVGGTITYRVNQEDFLENLKTICNSARDIGARPVLLTSPIATQLTDDPANQFSALEKVHMKYNEIIRSLAGTDNIDLIDLAAEFENRTDLYDDPSFDPIHFNSKGHQLVAESIAKLINTY